MPGGKSKRKKWRKPSSENSTDSDELHFTSTSSSDEEKQGRAQMNSDKESKRATSSEGKSGSGEGKTQDADEKEKEKERNLWQRVSLRMSGTLKKKGKPPLAQRKFSVGQKVWVNDSGDKSLARVLSIGSKGITVDVAMQKGQTSDQIPTTLLEPTAIGVDRWLQGVVRAFKEYDRSGSGMISRSDLQSFYTSIGFPASISFDRSRWWTTEVPLASTGHKTTDTTPPGFISLERFIECVMRCFPGLPPDALR